ELIIDNNNLLIPTSSSTTLLGLSNTVLSLTHLRVRRAARVRLDNLLNLSGYLEILAASELTSSGRIIADVISVSSNSSIIHPPTTAAVAFKVDLDAGTLSIDATSSIDVSALGFLGGGRPENPSSTLGMTIGFRSVNGSGTAGSYGGLGGAFSGSTNPLYGSQ